MVQKIDKLDAYFILTLLNNDIGITFKEMNDIFEDNDLSHYVIKYEANLKRSSDTGYSASTKSAKFDLIDKLYFPNLNYFFDNQVSVNNCIDAFILDVNKTKPIFRRLNHLKESILPNLVRTQSEGLSGRRKNIIVNTESKIQDDDLFSLIETKVSELNKLYEDDKIKFIVNKTIKLEQIHKYLTGVYGIDIEKFDKSHTYTEMRPDGGIIWMIKDGKKYPVLISEAKKQGTNDKLVSKGKKKQAKGNAIERLGKNLDGFEFLYLFDDIFPVVVFGYGCDFIEDSSILGRVSLMNYSFGLNNMDIKKESVYSPVKKETITLRKCAMMFRENKWESNEMDEIITNILNQSIDYFLNS